MFHSFVINNRVVPIVIRLVNVNEKVSQI